MAKDDRHSWTNLRNKYGLESREALQVLNCPGCGFERKHALFCDCGKPTWAGLWTGAMLRATEVAFVEHGLGVVATQPIPKRTLIESCPAYLFSMEDYVDREHRRTVFHLTDRKEDDTILGHMAFPWIYPDSRCWPLGNAMIYNHSWQANLVYWFRQDEISRRYFVDFFTLRDIREGEELFIEYGTQVWFPPYTDPSLK